LQSQINLLLKQSRKKQFVTIIASIITFVTIIASIITFVTIIASIITFVTIIASCNY
jgi:hypothetical protein